MGSEGPPVAWTEQWYDSRVILPSENMAGVLSIVGTPASWGNLSVTSVGKRDDIVPNCRRRAKHCQGREKSVCVGWGCVVCVCRERAFWVPGPIASEPYIVRLWVWIFSHFQC